MILTKHSLHRKIMNTLDMQLSLRANMWISKLTLRNTRPLQFDRKTKWYLDPSSIWMLTDTSLIVFSGFGKDELMQVPCLLADYGNLVHIYCHLIQNMPRVGRRRSSNGNRTNSALKHSSTLARNRRAWCSIIFEVKPFQSKFNKEIWWRLLRISVSHRRLSKWTVTEYSPGSHSHMSHVLSFLWMPSVKCLLATS